MEESASGYGAELSEFYAERMAPGERGDVAFYVERGQEADGPVLELACGTGRVYLELLRAGVDADGFDLSTDALSVLREKAADEGLDPSVWQDDLTDFSVEREYSLAYCPFNAVQHLRTVEDQLAALRAAYDALAPGGAFVFDVFVPDFETICETYGEWRTETFEYRGADHEYRTRPTLTDPVEQQFTVENELYGPDGEQVFDDEHRLKMLPKREVELLARLSPFDDWDVAGDFDGSPISGDDSIQVWTLRKQDV